MKNDQSNERPRVRDVMTSDLQVCQPQTEIYYVARMMAERDVGAIPVVESTESMRPVGIITDRDIVVRGFAKRQSPADLQASECMSTDLLTLRPEMSIDDATRHMEDRKVRRALVVDDAGRCVGIVAQSDIARHAQLQKTGELVQEISRPPGYQGAYH
jgi:CBS domain-containing protein